MKVAPARLLARLLALIAFGALLVGALPALGAKPGVSRRPVLAKAAAE